MEHPELSRYSIPWTPFRGSLEEATVGIVSTAGVRLKDDRPFDTDDDITYRVIEGDVSGADLAYDDTHYDHGCADEDINCIFPIDRLRELAEEGKIKGLAKRHFSLGFTMKLKPLREETLPGLLKEIERAKPKIVLLTGG